MDDLHKILQVRPGADDETIAAAYARLRRRYDPAFGGPFADPSALREVERAYALLSDPAARDAYEMRRLRDRAEPAPGDVDIATPSAAVGTSATRDPFTLETQERADQPPQTAARDEPRPLGQGLSSTPARSRDDLWRSSGSGGSHSDHHGSESPLEQTVALSTEAVPLRETERQPLRWLPRRWPGTGIVPITAGVFVVLGAGLAAWGIMQALSGAGEETESPEVMEESAQPSPEVEQTAAPEGSELAPPEVASSDALPEELREFAEGVIGDYEDDGGGYRVYDFVASTTEDGSIFYAGIAVREESELVGQAVFFFLDESFLGTDWEEAVRSVQSIASASGGEITVVYRNYGDNDEDCCPSGEPFVVVYRYDGGFRADNSNPPDGIFAE